MQVYLGEDDGSSLSSAVDEDGEESPLSVVRGDVDRETNVVSE